MMIGDYELVSQRSAGPDGASYRATDPNGELVEVRVLDAARIDPTRRVDLTHRIRAVGLIEHHAARRVLQSKPDDDPAYFVLEWVEPCPPVATPSVGLALKRGEIVAKAVAEAHRVGLVLGDLAHSRVGCANGALKLDMTGLRMEPAVPGSLSESTGSGPASISRADDVFDLGGLLARWSRPEAADLGETVDYSIDVKPGTRSVSAIGSFAGSLDELIRRLRAVDPLDRPTAAEALAELGRLHELLVDDSTEHDEALPAEHTTPADSTVHDSPAADGSATADAPPVPPPREPVVGSRLGRYRLLEKLGQGGMGTVYRATDPIDGSDIAVKVLKREWGLRPSALKRFRKEARLLAEVNNPFVTNLIDVNEDEGIHYLVLEYVRGRNLGAMLLEKGRLDEPAALAIAADLARALVDAHERGIVHRDIKPQNVLLDDSSGSEGRPSVKLADFGLARHVEETESLAITRDHAVVGTPQYMSPEQCTGGVIDPRTDVYALGVTLYEMLGGRPPFEADSLPAIFSKHCNEPPPPLRRLAAGVSDGVCRIVERCLAKAPETRYATAGSLLRDLEALLRGDFTPIAAHPRLPDCDPRELLEFDFSWDLDADPRRLWPLVTNTERLNRAVGLPAVEFSAGADSDGRVRHQGRAKQGGLATAWVEHPFEWLEPRRFGVLREYSRGPFRWMVSLVEMEARGLGGTRLHHRVRIAARSALMRTAARIKVGREAKKALERVYRRIDASLCGRLAGPVADAFEEAPALAGARAARLDAQLDRLIDHGIHPVVVESLGDFLAQAPPQEIARIRPLALAKRLGLDPDQVVAACLHGARNGLFLLLWDLLCPICRIPSEVKETLRQLQEHGRCEACDLDFELDFARSVELIFRVHPEVREAELGTYCIGGPAHSPHVVAQLRVASGEALELELGLSEGVYRLRGPQLPYAIDFRVDPGAHLRRWELTLRTGPSSRPVPILRSGAQSLLLRNDHDRELVVRVERTAPRDDALTAARASSLALFRDLFPGEMLNPGQLLNITSLTFLVARLVGAGELLEREGDAPAFRIIHEHFRWIDEQVRRAGGATVKTVGDALVSVFPEAARAFEAALGLASPPADAVLAIASGVHRGPAMVATLNDHLDYFGTTVRQATRLPELAGPGELVLTQSIASDVAVAALLGSRGLEPTLFEAVGSDTAGIGLLRLTPPTPETPSRWGSVRGPASPVEASPFDSRRTRLSGAGGQFRQ